MVKNSLAKFIFSVAENDQKQSCLVEFTDHAKEVLENDFKSVLNQLSSLFHGELEITITFLPADSFSQDWIAMYNAHQSTPEAFAFSFNEEVIQGLHMGMMDARRIEFQKAVLHELIHALDLAVLSESRNVYLSSSTQSFNLNPVEMPSNFWLFIHYLSTIRNEGVAMMAEELFFPNDALDVEHALLHFKVDFEFMLECCNSSDYSSKHRLKIQSICNNVHRYAGVLMDYVVQSPRFQNTAYDRVNTIRTALDIDLSEWLTHLIELYREDAFKQHAHGLFSYFHLPVGKEAIQWKLGQFYELYTYEDVRYVEFLSSMCAEKLSILEIEQKLQDYIQKDMPHDVVNTLTKQSLSLIAVRNDENADMIDWTLSYIFLHVDVIDDRLEFVGFLDDWMIMDSTAQRIFAKQ